MGDVAVHAAIGYQAHQVEGAAGLFGVGTGGQQLGVVKKGTIFNGFGDAGQLLIDHPACADVGVAHFAVAHLAGGQAHIHAGTADALPGAHGQKPVHHRGIGQTDGVGGARRSQAIAIQYDQSKRFFHVFTSLLRQKAARLWVRSLCGGRRDH